MKQILILILFSCAIILAGCNENTEQHAMDILPIIFDESLYLSYYDMTQDPYSFEEVKIEGDLLNIKISYLGGCGTHEFSLIFSENVEFSNPPRMHALLIHKANMDSCNVKLIEALFYDLTSLKEWTPVWIVIKDDSAVLFEIDTP